MAIRALFTIYPDKMDPEKVVRMTAARDELRASRKAIEDEFKSSERFGLLQQMVCSDGDVTLTWDEAGILYVRFELIGDYLAPATSPSLYLHETIVTALLDGTLLSDEEKRKLVDCITNGAIPANAA